MSRARVSAVRGVNVDGVMRTLVTRGLVEEAGTDPETGAVLYRTTTYFLERIGLSSLDELPALAPVPARGRRPRRPVGDVVSRRGSTTVPDGAGSRPAPRRAASRHGRPTAPTGPRRRQDVHDPDGVRLQKVLAQAGLGLAGGPARS